MPSLITLSTCCRRLFSLPVALRSSRPLIVARHYAPVGSHMCDNDPEIIEREIRKNLEGKCVGIIPDAPHWNENLASDSEACIKADRSFCGAPLDQLQHISIEILEENLDENAPTNHSTPSSQAVGERDIAPDVGKHDQAPREGKRKRASRKAKYH